MSQRKKKISKMAVFRILWTWATFEDGVMLTPENVKNLLKPYLKK